MEVESAHCWQDWLICACILSARWIEMSRSQGCEAAGACSIFLKGAPWPGPDGNGGSSMPDAGCTHGTGVGCGAGGCQGWEKHRYRCSADGGTKALAGAHEQLVQSPWGRLRWSCELNPDILLPPPMPSPRAHASCQ